MARKYEKVSTREYRPMSRDNTFDDSESRCAKPVGCEPVGVKESIIKSALSVLSDRLTQIDVRIDTLNDVISPILRRESCKAAIGDNEKNETVNCQLSVELEYMIGFAGRICEKIDDLLDRTQL